MIEFVLIVTLILPQGGVELHRVPLANESTCLRVARLLVRVDEALTLVTPGKQLPVARSSVECVPRS